MKTLAALLCVVGCVAAQVQTTTIPPQLDNTLYENATGGVSNAVGPSIFSGLTAINEPRRALLQFDIANAVPAGATILSANLTLECVLTVSGPSVFRLHRVSQAWGEGTSIAFGAGGQGGPSTTGDATWIHTFYPNSNWVNPGGDYAAYSSSELIVDQAGPYTWPSNSDVVADCMLWLQNPAQNFGWILRSDESMQDAKRFASRENTNPGFAPSLTLTYVTGTGASAIPVGNGCPPSGSISGFRLRTNVPPTIGDATFAVSAIGAPAGTPVNFYLADAVSIVPTGFLFTGCPVYLDLLSATTYLASGISPIGPIPSNAAEVATFSVPIPPNPGLAGLQLGLQALAIPPSGGILTNALSLTFQ